MSKPIKKRKVIDKPADSAKPIAKQEQADTGLAQSPAVTARTGGVILGVMVIFAAVWMQVLGTATLARVDNTGPQESRPYTGTERFSPDTWYLPAEDLLGFVRIGPGSFTMGSDPSRDSMAYENERWSDEQRQGRVDLPLYYIARYEVTVAQFRAFIEDTGYRFTREALQGDVEHPVRYVSWTDALAYANWLQSQLEQWTMLPDEISELFAADWRLSLPSEAEWEKAARGDDGRVFPWGSQAREDLANFNTTGTVAVGSIPCSDCAYNLADMSGNVWEMTRSPLQAYPYDATDDYDNLDAESLWVMRGGSFTDQAANVRASVRGAVDPGARRPTIGFRLVLTRF
ncbi:MAG: SUMF1/EgtB/PvdO family nonheme iron enzyme [Pseudohongiellaceae bacterium]